jgi:hypothetical protein
VGDGDEGEDDPPHAGQSSRGTETAIQSTLCLIVFLAVVAGSQGSV